MAPAPPRLILGAVPGEWTRELRAAVSALSRLDASSDLGGTVPESLLRPSRLPGAAYRAEQAAPAGGTRAVRGGLPCAGLGPGRARESPACRHATPSGRPLQQRLMGHDAAFVELVAACLSLDPRKRPSAAQLLQSSYFHDIADVVADSPVLALLREAAYARCEGWRAGR
jgi:hypothetical protein